MIRIEGLQKTLDGKVVLRDVNLTIPEGLSIAVAGRSGCGKTVLLKSIIGLMKPDRGRIFIDDDDITSLGKKDLYAVRRKFGMLFQGAALFDSLSVCDNIALPLREHTDLGKADILDKVREKLQMVGLAGAEDTMPAELSGGMKKRVGLARALVMEPRYILYDEPTTGLDPVTASSINDLITAMQERLNITSVIVTHEMESAFKTADRIALLHEGEIIYNGTVEQFRSSGKPEVREFLTGAPA